MSLTFNSEMKNRFVLMIYITFLSVSGIASN